MSKPMHCPYCITGGFGFEVMVRNTASEHVCMTCGHVAYPRNPWLQCSCERCRVAHRDPGKAEAESELSAP